MKQEPSDKNARFAALDPTKSFVVRAPAGSGKTELLTQRVLSLLRGCEKPEEIIAITFTQKAAAEMRDRIINALIDAQNTTESTGKHKLITHEIARDVLKRSKEKDWDILNNPGRLRIQTIDGFCRFLSRQQPVTSLLGTLPEVLDDNNKNKALTLSFRDLLQELSQDTTLTNSLENILEYFDNNISAVETLIVNMLGKREQWLEQLVNLPDEQSIQSANQKLVEHLLSQAYDALKPWHKKIVISFNHAVENLDQIEGESRITLTRKLEAFPKPDTSELSSWRELMSFILTDKNTIRKSAGINKNIGVPSNSKLKNDIKQMFGEFSEQPGLTDTLLMCRLSPMHPVDAEQLSILRDIQVVLLNAVARLRIIFTQMRATDYTEIALSAIQALGNDEIPSDLSLKLDYRIKHILVDEFQDTSYIQLHLLQKLTAGWQPDDGHTLFIVGDAMQSCYSFRKADVRIFLEIIKNGLGNIPLTTLTLVENFRSTKNIVDWNNAVFRNAFPKKEIINLSAVTYNPSTAFNETHQLKSVHCYGMLNDAGKLHEAQKIASIIQEIRRSNPDDTIAILVRSRNHAQKIFPCLKSANIAWQSTDMERLDQRMAIIDLMSLTRAMLYPADRLAWLSLLRSPPIGLDLHDLHRIAQLQDETNSGALPLYLAIQHKAMYNSLTEHGRITLERVVPHIVLAFAQLQRKPLRQWIEGLWFAIGGPAAVDPEQLEDCHHYFDLLAQFEQQGQISDWPSFEIAISKLYANNTNTAEKNPVQIMTIHKAKGLEFDHVILTGLAEKPRANAQEIFLWNEYYLDEDEQLLIMGIPAKRGDDENAHYHFLKSEQKKKDDYEAVRLLYVATTRAIKQLYLFASLRTDENGSAKHPTSSSLLFHIWEDFEAEAEWLDCTTATQSLQDDDTEALEHIRRLPASWQLPTLQQQHELAEYRGSETSGEDNTPEFTSLDNFVARQTGIIIHSCLQKICFDGLTDWDNNRIAAEAPFYKQQFIQLGIPKRLIPGAMAEFEDAIRKTLASEQGRWILDNRHPESMSEQELLFNGKLSIIDRSFVFNNERWIIDYKTASPSDGQTLENFMQQQIALYKNQMERYKTIVQKMNPLPIKIALYFPLLDELKIIV